MKLCKILMGSADCCSSLLRIYLLGDHVLSIFLFGPGPSPWPHLDRRPSLLRAVHFFNCLV